MVGEARIVCVSGLRVSFDMKGLEGMYIVSILHEV